MNKVEYSPNHQDLPPNGSNPLPVRRSSEEAQEAVDQFFYDLPRYFSDIPHTIERIGNKAIISTEIPISELNKIVKKCLIDNSLMCSHRVI